MNNRQKKGSQTAKDGFQNEKDIVTKFNNWEKDKDAQDWLKIMEYSLTEIEYVKAIVLSGYKTDVQVQVTIKLKKAIDVENLQVKLVSHPKGFNQIDKRWIDKYVEMWSIPDNIVKILKKYTGELKPTIKNPKDQRRTFMNEFNKKNQHVLLDWLNKNKSLMFLAAGDASLSLETQNWVFNRRLSGFKISKKLLGVHWCPPSEI